MPPPPPPPAMTIIDASVSYGVLTTADAPPPPPAELDSSMPICPTWILITSPAFSSKVPLILAPRPPFVPPPSAPSASMVYRPA